MNILFISKLYPYRTGNSEITVALHDMVKHWNRTENIVVVRPVYVYFKEIFTRWKDLFFKKRIVTLDNVTVIVFPVYKIPRWAYFFKPLFRFLDRHLEAEGFKPDLVIAHYDKCLNIGLEYAQKRGLPFAAGFHITPDLMSENPADFAKRCGDVLENAVLIACRSAYILDKISNWFPRYKEKCFVSFSGIDRRLILEADDGIARMKQWKRGGEVSIVCVASFIKRKHVDKILMALALLTKRIDWSFTLFGDGDERERLTTLTRELGLSERVRFMGRREHREVLEAMRHTHIFVLVSCLETFGLVYLEAMARGNIVIGSSQEGIDGIIEDGKNGFLSPAGEVEALKEKLEDIILQKSQLELEKLLMESFKTINQYTEEKAALNYLNQLKKDKKKEVKQC
ncbi:MAG: glycosyltransferase family 4 protein [bacterium]|nr:glycosyltransferase family 4 protein [bacterium]